MSGWRASVAAVIVFLGGCPDRPADSAIERPRVSPDASVAEVPASPHTGDDDYEFVASRPHIKIGVAETRGLAKTRVHPVVEGLAETFAKCLAARENAPSTPRRGALRLVLAVGANGQAEGFNLNVAEEARGAALVCLVAPARAQNYGQAEASNARTPGVAIEAVWNLDGDP
jgi:hypothetical protein